ncbi:MAG: hypothetical protein N4J56_004619 [Chroococcidiopsis sp. SAG 2025]|uniref:hypothetical protein n=1 Tax=Chroococcidiopsis sp. SAG 2025 TaxID=171389 RepID=UPI002936D942|nr:hypothetical protein [Chroococcidiopsis sp. SAG 2025]MDV2994965.1 hypothetical protein [Chroococcidiopsis sp. SAG 2025]
MTQQPDYHKYIADIEDCAAKGMTHEDIADYIGTATRTFRYWCKVSPEVYAAYKRGRAKAKYYVVGKLFDLIREGNVAATIFYLKTRCRWRETGCIEDDLTAPDTAAPLDENSIARIKTLIRETEEEMQAMDDIRQKGDEMTHTTTLNLTHLYTPNSTPTATTTTTAQTQPPTPPTKNHPN